MVMVLSRRPKILPAESKARTLEIRAFDVGKSMCRLVCLYHSLSDGEITRLRGQTTKSKGVAYLTSHQECFLLNLAAAELLEDLDAAAITVSQLGRKCSDVSLSRFDLVYNDLKLGVIDLRKLGYATRSANKVIGKMEKLVATTGNLHTALETMAELEASEKKMQRCNNNYNYNYSNNFPKPNVDYLKEKIEFQRKQVQHYKEVSLWNQTFDKTVGIMAKVVCIVYARICSVFGGCVSLFSDKNNDNDNLDNSVYCLLEHRVLYQNNLCLSDHHQRGSYKTKSGPLFSKTNKLYPVNFYSGALKPDRIQFDAKSICNEKCGNVLKLAPSNTVGGARLAFKYANVILFAERCFNAPPKGARETLYEMLPERLRVKVRAKLKARWRKGENGMEECDALADGWREAVEELLDWLLPVAHDTVRWHSERLLEKKPFEVRERVLLLQTLHYSDLEKVEAAIVEVLVGLSYIYLYEKRL
ncbi:uncharacterized protein LOC130963182 [Arachis stenosperma]|uniref:uncharacterized protein LOC130963182 n=1 Tax=Arachis stenosperma TaxID=217475 RepID=UPI0025AC6130|nr:uncharacterized protein LOC130963182 [Arachis stenosperma]